MRLISSKGRSMMAVALSALVAAVGFAQADNTITIVSPMYHPTLPDPNSEVMRFVEKATGAKIKVDYVPKPNYLDKLNVLVASNSLPMVTVTEAGHIKSNTVVSLAKAGGFWQIDPTFAKYPNLKAFYSKYPLAITNTLISGKLYGLPRPRPTARTGLVYRADWLANVGLKAPTTIDEFVRTAKSLTEKDAGKNGTRGSLGYLYADISYGSPGWNGISNLCVALGGPNFWGEVNGRLVPDVMTEEYLQALTIFRDFYKGKIMNQDFPLASGAKRYDPFNRGQAGMYFGTLNDIYDYHDDLFRLQPHAKLAITPPLAGPKGIRVNGQPGHNGLILFSKKAVKTEADLDRVLRLFDKMLEPAVMEVLHYGIENVHYTKTAGKHKSTPEQKRALGEEIGDFLTVYLEHDIVELDDDNDLRKTAYAALRDYQKYVVPNPVDPFVSPTYVQLGGQLEKILQDARVRYVMGELDAVGYKAKIQEWWAKGGEKVANEYTEMYVASIKN